MSESLEPAGPVIPNDPTTVPYWQAALRGELALQRCPACGEHQHYPRPFCLSCGGRRLRWVAASGRGEVLSQTTVRVPVNQELPPPYVVAVVRLAEGPSVLTNIVGGAVRIGDPVELSWRQRPTLPPVPVFAPAHDRSEVSS